MATFQEQVQDLTSLTVSDTDELSQFLKDGVIDVTNKWLAIRPQDADMFMASTAEQTSNGADLNGAKIITVVREDGTNNQWRKCRKISLGLQYDVTDPDSLNYASAINPAYMQDEDGKISVFPVPGSDPNAYKIYYVNNTPVDASGSALAYNDTDIKYFPSDKIYLVTIYASMRLVQATIGGIANLSITAVPPDVPSAPSFAGATVTLQTAGSLGTAPTYTAPVVTGDTQEITGTIVAGAAGTSADQVNFNHWYDVLADLIETEEDTELAVAQIQKINSYIGAYQAAIQNQLNIFNDANVDYQSTVQKALQELQVASAKAQKDADLEQQKQITEYSSKLQRFQNEIAAYQADIGGQVQEHGAKMQGLQAQYNTLRQQYTEAFGIAAPKQPQGAR